jgi:hypothetical protein
MPGREIQGFDDLSEIDRDKLFTGQHLADNASSEVREVFVELAEFARVVTDGGAWPFEKVYIMNKRAENLKDKLPEMFFIDLNLAKANRSFVQEARERFGEAPDVPTNEESQ